MTHRRFHDKFFDKGLKGWIVKTARKHYWRVAAWHDLDDIIQEGLLAYAICRHRYHDKVENRAHFMRLVQVVYLNRLHDLANERTMGEDVSISQIAAEGKELQALEYLAGGYEGDAELQAVLRAAPDEVRKFLNLFNSPEGIAKLEMPLRRYRGGQRETTTDHMTWLLGKPVEDMEATMRNLLGVAA